MAKQRMIANKRMGIGRCMCDPLQLYYILPHFEISLNFCSRLRSEIRFEPHSDDEQCVQDLRSGKLPHQIDGVPTAPNCAGYTIFGWPPPNHDKVKYDGNVTGFVGSGDCRIYVFYTYTNDSYWAFVRDKEDHPMGGVDRRPRRVDGHPFMEFLTGSWNMTIRDISPHEKIRDIGEGQPVYPNARSLKFSLRSDNPVINKGRVWPRHISWNTSWTPDRCNFTIEPDDAPRLKNFRHWVCPFQCNVTQGVPQILPN